MRAQSECYMDGQVQRRKIALAVILVLLTSLAVTPLVRAQSATQTQADLGQAYAAVLNAEQSGGNVTALVAKLDSAIALVQQANLLNSTDPTRAQSLYAQASTLAQQVISSAPAVAAAGRASVLDAQIELGIETAVLAALAVLAYLFVPRLFWRYWSRTHSDWRVKKP
ncbi:MAG: hypothetical protein JRN27_07930 [Nitrososphaerota archaeon]|nr:hypothetical protein [Nitrososphaerota archaeon]